MRSLRFSDPDGVCIDVPIPDRLKDAIPQGVWMVGTNWYMRFVWWDSDKEAYLLMPEGIAEWRFLGFD